MSRIRLARSLLAAVTAAWPATGLAQSPATASAVAPPPQAAARPSGNAPSPVTLAQFEKAAQIAKLAAEQGMHELSLRAIRRALANGPPIDLEAIPTLGKPKPRRMSRSTFGAAATSSIKPDKINSDVSQTLDALAQSWQKAPAEDVFETLAAVVLPEGRPREIFLYDDFLGAAPQRPAGRGFPSSPARSRVTRGTSGRIVRYRSDLLEGLGAVQWPVVSRLLVDAAARAGRIDDLKQRVSARDDEHAEFAATILSAQLALIDGHLDAATCWPYLERLARHEPPVYASQLLHELIAKIEGPEMPAEMVAWLEARAAVNTAEARQLADNQTWLKLFLALADWQFANGNIEPARRNLKRYAEFGLDGEAQPDEQARYQATRWLRVAGEFVRAELIDDALDALATHVDVTEVPANEMLLTPVWLKLRRLLLERLSATDRYKRLVAWTMPEGERRQPRFLSCLVPHDGRPAVFQNDLYRSWPDDAIASNSQLVVDAARQAGLLEDLKERLSGYPANASIEVAALYVLLAVETGREEEAAPVIDRLMASQQAAPATTTSTTTTSRPPPFSGAAFLLTRTCLRSPRLRQRGAALAQLCGRRVSGQIARLLDVESTAATGRDFGLDLKGLAGPRFAHWRVAHAGENWMTPFYAPAVWAADGDYLRCVNGRGTSALVFDCPLIGSGEISVDLITRGAWGSFTYGGISIGTHGVLMHDSTFPAMVIDSRPTARPVGVRSDVNRWTLHMEPEANLALNKGKLVYNIPPPSAAAPWLVLCSWSPADAVFRRLTITGDWRIPREVNLVEGNRLVGWRSGFYDEPQTPQPFPQRRMRRGFGAADQSSTATAGAVARGSLPAFLAVSAPPARRVWVGNGETINGMHLRMTGRATPSPSRLTYFRPLQNGDVLRYEFAYQPGVMVHPALDRLTFLLEPEGVRLHWMTDHPDFEAGDLPLGNVADEPAARRGPARLPLVERDWNRVELKLVDDEILIELNGVLVFERKLESTNDRLFSFFHYQDQTQAMVRNVVLSGDWPEKLPPNEELFARVRPLSEAERGAEAKLVNAEQFQSSQPEVKEKKQ